MTEKLADVPSSDLIDRLRYQCGGPSVTTMGWCSQECGRAARGGRLCVQCLCAELAERGYAGYPAQYAHHMCLARAAMAEIEDMKER